MVLFANNIPDTLLHVVGHQFESYTYHQIAIGIAAPFVAWLHCSVPFVLVFL